MAELNPWDLLRHGDAKEGIALIRESYPRDPSASHIMQLGVGYLWVGDYQAASDHFEDAIKTDRLPVAIYYGMSGVAHWCLEYPGTAVRVWNRGLDAPFTDGGGGVHLPLLMVVGAILRIEMFRKEAEGILKERMEDPQRKQWLKNWPGPLAKFAIGAIDNKALAELCIARTERETLHRKWLAEFYMGVIEYGRGALSPTDLREVMRKTADTSTPELSDERNFLTRVWSEEFFIARHEASLEMPRWLQLLQGAAPPPWFRQGRD